MKYFYSALFVLAAASCSLFSEDEPEAPKVLLELFTEPAGTACAYGGLKVATGIDENRNNVLDNEEITDFQYCCNYAPKNGVPGKITTFPYTVSDRDPSERGISLVVGHDFDNSGGLDRGYYDWFSGQLNSINEIGYITRIYTDKSTLVNEEYEFTLPDLETDDGSVTISRDGNINDFDLTLFSRYRAWFSAWGCTYMDENLLTIELYNITDDEAIPESKAKQYMLLQPWVYGISIRPTVYPAKRIELGVRISGQKPGQGFSVVNGILVFSNR